MSILYKCLGFSMRETGRHIIALEKDIKIFNGLLKALEEQQISQSVSVPTRPSF